MVVGHSAGEVTDARVGYHYCRGHRGKPAEITSLVAQPCIRPFDSPAGYHSFVERPARVGDGLVVRRRRISRATTALAYHSGRFVLGRARQWYSARSRKW